MTEGILLTISAPSGTGKSTLISMLTREHPEFSFSVSYTTRNRRKGEENKKEYYFVDQAEFLSLRDSGYFAEWAMVHGNYYGTPKQKVLEALGSGTSLIFDIDVQGAAQLKQNLKTGLYVFIFPPSLKDLENRLLKRGTDDRKTIQKRIDNARHEISQSRLFDYWVINDNLDTAYDDLCSIVRTERLKPLYNPDMPDIILETGEGQGLE